MDLRLKIRRWRNLSRGFVFIYFIVIVGIILLISSQSNQIRFGATAAFRPIDFITRNPRFTTSISILKHPASNATNFKPMWKTFVKSAVNQNDEVFQHWLGNEAAACDNKFIGYNNLFARLRNVTLDPSKGHGRKGGENISDVFNQAEDAEYFKLAKGYFNLNCKGKLQYSFNSKDHLSNWFNVIDTETNVIAKNVKKRWTIAVMRYEYANLYHTMTDYYNAFLMTIKFNLNPDETDILFIDGHPVGALDSTWETLFGNVTRAGRLNEAILYPNMIWNILGYYSPLSMHKTEHTNPVIPLVEQFRQFFLSRHGIHREKVLSCDKLTVLFLWRRDYLAHPRNPTGKVSRKVKNEDELIFAVTDLLPGHDVRGVQIDKFSMKMQLQLISETDVLIGMHGAGLSHALFLPPHAGLIELYPNYWPTANRHFRAIATWRHLHYSVWSNSDSRRELPDKYTEIDEKAVVKMVHEMHHILCGDQADV